MDEAGACLDYVNSPGRLAAAMNAAAGPPTNIKTGRLVSGPPGPPPGSLVSTVGCGGQHKCLGKHSG